MNQNEARHTVPTMLSNAAFWEFFNKQIRGFVMRRVPTRTDAEDVLQDVYVRLHQGASTFQNRDRLHEWVFTIARRTVADFYRRQFRALRKKKDVPHEVLLDQIVTNPTFSLSTYHGDHDIHEEVLSWLRPMINKLPEKYGKALWLADVEGLRQRDVATQLGLSLSGAKSRVQRARVLLGEMLQNCCDIEFGQDGRAVSYHRRSPRNK